MMNNERGVECYLRTVDWTCNRGHSPNDRVAECSLRFRLASALERKIECVDGPCMLGPSPFAPLDIVHQRWRCA